MWFNTILRKIRTKVQGNKMRYGSIGTETIHETHWFTFDTPVDNHGWVKAWCGELVNTRQGEVDLLSPTCNECLRGKRIHDKITSQSF
jgi:hypothetical protein